VRLILANRDLGGHGQAKKGIQKISNFFQTGESSSDNGEAKNATPKSEEEEEEEEEEKA
jgi:hypothetical protein